MLNRLTGLGISSGDAMTLRRVAMTLHRWQELTCGTDLGAIERDEDTGRCYWQNGRHDTGRRWRTPDREKGAVKRLAAIMTRYPALDSYVQGDPRGASLYILRPGDIPDGADPDAYFSRGIAVYQ